MKLRNSTVYEVVLFEGFRRWMVPPVHSIDTADGGSRIRHPDRWLTGRPAEGLV